jgi:hypothetical protein
MKEQTKQNSLKRMEAALKRMQASYDRMSEIQSETRTPRFTTRMVATNSGQKRN